MKIKLLYIIISFYSTFGFILTSYSEPVDSLKAELIARNFFLLNSTPKRGNNSVESGFALTCHLKLSDSANVPVYFIYQFESNKGFVIISADDATIPVLGYSFNGNFDKDQISPAFKSLLESYKQQILYVKSKQLKATDEVKKQWTYIQFKRKTKRGGNKIEPLIKTKWDQGIYYNLYCPLDPKFPGSHTPTGCGATGMAQLMKYWNYPRFGTGNISYNDPIHGRIYVDFSSARYDWINMPNQLAPGTPLKQDSAVAKLMFHCGAALETKYDVSGSSVDGGKLPSALSTYFGYNSNSLKFMNKELFSDTQWTDSLKSELNAGRPILYMALGKSSLGDEIGHLFICDGFDSDYFHFNFGWSGSGDGYFFVSAIKPVTPTVEIYYSTKHFILKGIMPKPFTEISLISAITPEITQSALNESITVKVNLKNTGNLDFDGEIVAKIENGKNETIRKIGLLQTQIYTGNSTGIISFYKDKLLDLPFGNYYIAIYYRKKGGTWQLVEPDAFQNPIPIKIENLCNNNLKLVERDIQISLPNIYRNHAFDLTFKILNSGSSEFKGDIKAYIFDSTFSKSVVIENKTNITISTGTNKEFIFHSNGIDLKPAKYYIFIGDSLNSGITELVNPGFYKNPVAVNIIEISLPIDKYEYNDRIDAAYNLPLNFTSNSLSIRTVGSNFNNITDSIDYYKLDLPKGYYYKILVQIFDRYNPKINKPFLGDAQFAQHIAKIWPLPNNFKKNDSIFLMEGDVLYIKVNQAHNIPGNYEMSINISRISNNPVDHLKLNEGLKIIPDTVYPEQTFNISFKVLNDNSIFDFTGLVSLEITDLNNNLIKEIYKSESISIVKKRELKFNCAVNSNNIKPGNYNILVKVKTTAGEWKVLNQGNYQNPMKLLIYPSNKKDIMSLSFEGTNTTRKAIISGTEIKLSVPYNTDICKLIVKFTNSSFATVKIGSIIQTSGITTNDFSKSLTYTVVAQDGSLKNYNVNVIKELSPENDLLSFSIENVNPAIKSTINGTEISLRVPYNTDLSKIIPSFISSAYSIVKLGSVVLTSGVTVNDFSKPLTYTIVAQNGSSKNYIVTVTKGLSPENEITAFSFEKLNPALKAIINGTNISLTVPYNLDITNLAASFLNSDKSLVEIDTFIQVSGVNINDFTKPVIYNVIAQNGSVKNYIVTLTKELSPENELLSFGFENLNPPVNASIIGTELSLIVPYNVDITRLIAKFTNSPLSSLKIGTEVQISGITVNDYSKPLIYSVVAQNGSTKNYIVKANKELSPENDILSYSFENLSTIVNATISGLEINLTVPYNADVTKLRATFSNSALSKVTIDTLVQLSSTSVNDFSKPLTYSVTAQNGSINYYLVTVKKELSPEKELLSFSFEKISPLVKAEIKGTDIILNVPYYVDPSALVSTFTNSNGSVVKVGSIQQVSGVTSNDFSKPLQYTVVAQDGSEKNYFVTVNRELSPEKELISFSINTQNQIFKAEIKLSEINLKLPASVNLKSLIAIFEISKLSTVKIGDQIQLNNISANDFTKPLTFTVVAEDGTSRDYTVTITKEQVLGIEETNSAVLKIYPNPSNGLINIIFNNQDITKHFIEVINICGKLIYKNQCIGTNWQINLIGNKGIFFIKISNENTVRIGKVVLE